MGQHENPPAFPLADQYRCDGEPLVQGQSGMSLRDWFAGQTLAAWPVTHRGQPEELAANCYRMADAMLAERAKTEGRS